MSMHLSYTSNYGTTEVHYAVQYVGVYTLTLRLCIYAGLRVMLLQ